MKLNHKYRQFSKIFPPYCIFAYHFSVRLCIIDRLVNSFQPSISTLQFRNKFLWHNYDILYDYI